MSRVMILGSVIAAALQGCVAPADPGEAAQPRRCLTCDGGGVTIGDGIAATNGWVATNYPGASYDTSVDCATGSDSHGNTNVQCTVTIDWFGAEHYVGCSLWSDGRLSCGVDD